jgi:integrase
VIKDAQVGESTKSRMKSLFNLMYKWCMIHEVVEKDYSALFVQKIGKRNKENRVPFSPEEIATLWQHEEAPFIDLILFGLYTGFRPTEICLIENENVDLDGGVIVGGMKTEAGTDRIVPIHSLIRDIVRKHYRTDRKFLFVDERQTGLTYDQYRGRFKHIMQWLRMTHTPHETRHTFITNAEANGMPRDVLKLIVGHELYDVTEKYYIHRSVDDLKRDIELVNYSQK